MVGNNTKIIFDVQANIDQLRGAASEIEKAFSKLNLPQSIQKSFTGTFSTLTKEIREFEVAAEKGFETLSDVSKGQRSLDKISDSFAKLKLLGKDISGLDMKKLLPDSLVEKYKKLQDAMKQVETLQKQDNTKAVEKATTAYEKQAKKVEDLKAKISKLNAENASTKGSQGALTKQLNSAKKEADSLVSRMKELESTKGGKSSAEYTQLKTELQAVNNTIKTVSAAIDENRVKMASNKSEISGLNSALANEEATLTALKTKLDEVTAAGTNTAALQKLRQDLANLLSVDISKIPTDLDGIKAKIEEAASSGPELEKIAQYIQSIGNNADTAKTQVGDLGQKFNTEVRESVVATQNLNSEMDQLKTRLGYFFSIVNGVQLFKRAIRDAYESVKDLDAAMTEMAVVTKYNVGDLWAQMPQYAENANKLGATTLDVYKSMVLYTQQGLSAAQAQELSNETLKMARIAGIEAADATDAMTSALRGFNMELTEASGQRVNDVYSNLAAHAAANTEEISNAMMRTASIAHSAGMEFETTAAFLTQMIETTREPAENLGTAMKTIVARFTEMKKDPTGIVNVEGEDVDVNKVDAALKSVGVSLKDVNGQFRDLDDVFLELSSKWDSLDIMQQRYVATMAAGSRQQSRFIAMMSDYQRTMELTGYATNSAGASQKQFEKTMESLESKVNRLHNAWETYTTGIANASTIKAAVDLLTSLLTAINKITEATDPAHTGITKILVAILGFKAAKGIVNGALRNIGTQLAVGMGKEGVKSGTAYSTGFISKIKKLKVTTIGDGNAKQVTKAYKELQEAQVNAQVASTKLTAAQANQANVVKSTSAAIQGADSVETKRALTQEAYNQRVEASLAVDEAKRASEEANAVVAEKEAVVNGLVATSEERLQAIQNLGIARRIRLAAVLAFGTEEKKAEILANYGLITTDQAEAVAKGEMTVAQLGFNSALEACPIMWIITAIALLIAGIILLCKWLNKASEEKAKKYKSAMEGVAEATEDATEKAEEAREAYTNLLQNKGTYNKLKEELRSLVQGSDEYIEKLQETRKLINELIADNPDLTQYVTVDEYGEPSITPEGWQFIKDRAAENALIKSLQSSAESLTTILDTSTEGLTIDTSKIAFTVMNDEYTADTYRRNDTVQYQYSPDEAPSPDDDSPTVVKGISGNYWKRVLQYANDLKITTTEIPGYRPISSMDSSGKEQIYYISEDAYADLQYVSTDSNGELITSSKWKEYVENGKAGEVIGNLTDETLVSIFSEVFSPLNEKGISAFDNYNKNVEGNFQLVLGTALMQSNGDTERNPYWASAFSNFYAKEIRKNNNPVEIISNIQDKIDEYLDEDEYTLQQLIDIYSQIDETFDASDLDELTQDEEGDSDEAKKRGYLAKKIANAKVFNPLIEDAITVYDDLMQNHHDNFIKILTIGSKKIDNEIDDSLLQALIQWDDASQWFDSLGEDGKDFTENILPALGMSVDDFEQYWDDAATQVQSALGKTFSLFYDQDIIDTLTQQNPNIDWTKSIQEKLISQLGTKAAFNLGSLAQIWEQEVEEIGGKLNTEAIFSSFLDSPLFSDAQAAEETYERIAQIDFTNPVQAAAKISELARSTNSDYAALGAALKKNTVEITSAAKQAKYIYESIDSDTMSDLFEDSVLTKDEVIELTKTLPDLRTMLDANSLSASTLATYFTKVHSGMLDINTTAQEFIVALDKINKAQNIITDSLDYVNSFSASESQQGITDAFIDWRESMETSLERGQYGDQNLIDYSKAILGLDNWNKYYAEFEGNLQKVEELALSKIQLWGDNFYGLWSAFAGESSIVSIGSSGEISFDLSQISSIDELRQELMDTFDISEEVAEAAIADAQTYSSTLTEELKKLSLDDSIKTLLESSFIDGTSVIVSKAELSVIAEAADITTQELINHINANLKSGYKLDFGEIIDSATGQLVDEFREKYQTELNKTEGLYSAKVTKRDFSSTDVTAKINLDSKNLNTLYTEFIQKGLKPDQATAEIQTMLRNAFSDNDSYIYFKDGIIYSYKKANAAGAEDAAQKLGIPKTQLYNSIEDAIAAGATDGLQDPRVQYQREIDAINTTKETATAITVGIIVGEKTAEGEAIGSWATSLYTETRDALDAAFSEDVAKLEAALAKIDSNITGVDLYTGGSGNYGGYSTSYTTPTSQYGWNDDDDDSSSSDSDEDDWTNDWNRQYALLKKIAAIERERTRLDKEHDRWVKSYALMESDIVKNKEKQRKNLMKQIELNKDLAQQTRNELESLNWYSGFGGSIWYDQENNMIRTNDEHIRNMDKETKEAFDDVKSQYESLASQLEDAQDNIESAVEAIEELTSAITEIDYQTQLDSFIKIIDHTLSLYDKAIARLDRPGNTPTKSKVLNLFNAASKERVEKNKTLTESYIRSGAQLNALLNLSDYKKYFSFDWDTGKLTRNSAYYSLGDSDLKDKIDAHLTKIEDLAEQRRTADEEREDLADEQYEAEKAIAEKANEWQKNVYDAVVSEREEQISKLETINTSIQDASSKLIDSMQKSIQKIRQDRKNEKTEEELSDMQSKLSYLQADTSGANEVEIKKLQKQLTEKQESYTDTLIDQKISELQDQNKEAAEQRKMQIEIAKAQLQYDKQTGAIWSEVRGLIAIGLSSNGTINKNSELGKLLTKWGNVNSLSAYDKSEYWTNQNYGSASYGANQSITGGGSYQDQFGYTVTNSEYNSMRNTMIKEAKAALSDYVNNTTPYKNYMRYDSSKNTLIQTELFPYPEGDEKALHDTLEAAWWSIWERINYINGLIGYFDVNNANTSFTHTPGIARHAKGGLVDYTGLHWLDGTTSEPELVLNAKDTKNFLALKDILSGVMKNSSAIPHNNGDVNCEITINVDSISNDYDVDQIAKRIEYNIMQSANWRNVNNLSMMR